jgi:thymidylate synthase (FAD)
MNVTLLRYDPDALDLLVMTKQTRLGFTPAELNEVKGWSMAQKLSELNYMLGTIESSWEFADYVFLITGVSRAFTHQFVRTREGSYAQQSQRTVNMEGFDYIVTGPLTINHSGPEVHSQASHSYAGSYPDDSPTGSGGPSREYHDAMAMINEAYHNLTALGVPPQDARGILPTNVSTAIVGKFNLRTLSHMAALRLCTRTQGEYQDVFKAMRAAVVAVHPWAEPFLRVHCARHGVCAFPHYKECPIKGPIFNPDTGRRWDVSDEDQAATGPLIQPPATRDEIQQNWVQLQRRGGYEARPKETPRA